KPPLRLVHPVPAVVRRVRVDPRRWAVAHLRHRGAHDDRRATELRHATAGFPLRLPRDVAIQPEAALALDNQGERLVKPLLGDQLPTAREERALLEPKRIDRAERVGGDRYVLKA